MQHKGLIDNVITRYLLEHVDVFESFSVPVGGEEVLYYLEEEHHLRPLDDLEQKPHGTVSLVAKGYEEKV